MSWHHSNDYINDIRIDTSLTLSSLPRNALSAYFYQYTAHVYL